MKSLRDKFLIFDYATQFCLKHETIASADEFHFTEFDDFVAFLNSRNYKYDSESEKLVQKLKEEAVKEKYATAIEGEIRDIEVKLRSDKKNDLYKHKDEIVNAIEKEIASRYYFQKGEIKISLRNDIEVSQAIKLLDDQTKFKSILNK